MDDRADRAKSRELIALADEDLAQAAARIAAARARLAAADKKYQERLRRHK